MKELTEWMIQINGENIRIKATNLRDACINGVREYVDARPSLDKEFHLYINMDVHLIDND